MSEGLKSVSDVYPTGIIILAALEEKFIKFNVKERNCEEEEESN